MTAHSNANMSNYYIGVGNSTSVNLPSLYSITRSPGPVMTTTGTTFTYTSTTTFNGDPSDPTLFMTAEQKLEHQQKSYLEPRDHEFNPAEAAPGWLLGSPCRDCYQHNVHRMSADKHLFVIQEEVDPDWLSQLAS